MKRVYNQELLEEKLIEDKATLIKVINKSNKISRESKIYFRCNCGEEHNKNFRIIVETSGLFCKYCTNINKQKKTVKTNNEKYNCDNVSQVEEFKNKREDTMVERWGVNNAMKNDEIKNKRIVSCNLNHGVDYPLQNKEIREKFKKTCIGELGFDNPMKNDNIKEKVKATNMIIWGQEYASQNEEVKQKTRETNMYKWGKEYIFQTDYFKAKSKETHLRLYNVINSMHSPELFSKQQRNSFKLKPYLLPSNKTIYIQGYENFALDILLKMGIKEDDIETNNIVLTPISYSYNDKEHKHHIDIYIKSLNLVIEVKSDFTYNTIKDKNNAKQISAKEQGINYQFWIINRKGKLLEIKE